MNDPFCVQVELTEGCNLRCSFCGLNGIRGKENDFKFLSVETATLIASQMRQAGWTSRVEFAMHGEPSMNQQAAEIVRVFRAHLPGAYLLMLSNGGGLVADPLPRIRSLFAAGLNTLGLDQYQGISLVPRIRAKIQGRVGVAEFDYPDGGAAGNPHARSPRKRLIYIAPIDSAQVGTHSVLNNHCGAGAPLSDEAAGQRCAKPFREFSFRWDGSAAFCCNDWRGEFPIGNIHRDSLIALWRSPRMEAGRRRLILGRRDFRPCRGCTAVSYRVGLLPDPLGKEVLPLPTPEDEEVIAAALAEGPLTKPVPRPWEC